MGTFGIGAFAPVKIRDSLRQGSGQTVALLWNDTKRKTLVRALVPGLGGGVVVVEAEAWGGGAGARYVG